MHKLTEILLEHRAAGIPIVQLPAGVEPQTAEDAYRIQNETIEALGPVGAWKVQPIPATGQPFAAPILASSVLPNGATLHARDFGSLGIEVEVAVIIAHDLPAQTQGYQPADMKAAIASIHIAFELLASRFVDRKQVPQLTGIADLQHSGAVVIGPAVAAHVLPEFGQQSLDLSTDGAVVAETAGNATTENMLAALAWLANHASARGLPLMAGQIVITGARLGPVPLTGKRVEARGEGLGAVSVTFD